MTEILQNLYYLVDDWVGQQFINDPEMKELLERQNVLQEEIIRRLGEDGQDTMEALFNLNLELETIHDQALFRTAMQLGTELAQPRRRPWAAEWSQ